MAVNQSYAGHVSNPITDTRVRLAMSGPALAKRLGLSRQYINRAEHGTYSSLNPDLLRWVANENGFTIGSVQKRYEKFQNAQRRATLERINPHPFTLGEPEGFHFERWRSGYWPSPLSFSVGMAIHPDLIQKFEEGITRTMPKLLRQILIEFELLIEASEGESTGAPVTASQAGPLL